MKRNFAEWLLTFTDSIANYRYYIDFETIYKNAEIYKIELKKNRGEELRIVVGLLLRVFVMSEVLMPP